MGTLNFDVGTLTFYNYLFHENTKISKENLRVDYYLLLKYCRRQCPLRPLSGPHKLLTIKIQQQIERFLTCFRLKLQEKKKELNNLIFSIGFQMLQI